MIMSMKKIILLVLLFYFILLKNTETPYLHFYNTRYTTFKSFLHHFSKMEQFPPPKATLIYLHTNAAMDEVQFGD